MKTQIPVIFMSGYTFDSLHEQGLFREEVMLLNKPIQPLELLTRIRENSIWHNRFSDLL